MKLKYSASIALALWLGVVAWVSALIVAKPTVGQSYPEGSDSAATAQLQLSINHNQQLLGLLDRLGGSDPYGAADLAVAVAADAPADTASTDGATAAVPTVHRLSLILSSDRGRRAVIDGQWASPGGRLEDGSRVRAIGPHHVLLDSPAGERIELRMPMPFASAGHRSAAPEER